MLAGVIGGLLARGAPPVEAAIWGVWLHGAAGRALSETIGPLGFLAREILDQIPRVMSAIAIEQVVEPGVESAGPESDSSVDSISEPGLSTAK